MIDAILTNTVLPAMSQEILHAHARRPHALARRAVGAQTETSLMSTRTDAHA